MRKHLPYASTVLLTAFALLPAAHAQKWEVGATAVD